MNKWIKVRVYSTSSCLAGRCRCFAILTLYFADCLIGLLCLIVAGRATLVSPAGDGTCVRLRFHFVAVGVLAPERVLLLLRRLRLLPPCALRTRWALR